MLPLAPLKSNPKCIYVPVNPYKQLVGSDIRPFSVIAHAPPSSADPPCSVIATVSHPDARPFSVIIIQPSFNPRSVSGSEPSSDPRFVSRSGPSSDPRSVSGSIVVDDSTLSTTSGANVAPPASINPLL